MRCPSCGTENAPDSRFCGGCGARTPTAHKLVAATEKMSDDTPYPQPDTRALTTRPAPGAPPPAAYAAARGPTPPAGISIPPQNRSPSQPPGQTPMGSQPPQGRLSTPPAGNLLSQRQHSQPPRASTTPPMGTSTPRRNSQQPRRGAPGEAFAGPPPRRRWGLIAVVLLIDVGLAASGAWLLRQGLASSAAAPEPTDATKSSTKSSAAPRARTTAQATSARRSHQRMKRPKTAPVDPSAAAPLPLENQ